MNTLFTKTVSIFHLICIAIILILLVGFWLYFEIENEKWVMLIGSTISGLIVVLVTVCLSYYEFKKIERFRQMGVKDMLPERTDKKYYEEILRDAKTHVQVMGTSCTRFLDDFGNQSRQEHVLVEAMDNNTTLKLQILVPDEKHMDEESKQKFNTPSMTHIINNLKNKYPERFKIKRFNFSPSHSLVRADHELIVGPILPKVDSRHTPAIHLKTSSEYAKKYIQYYEDVWTDSDG